MLKGVSTESGTAFKREIHTLDEVRESGTYTLVGNNATEDDGLPPAEYCDCKQCYFEAMLEVSRNSPFDGSTDKETIGQKLTITNSNDGSINTYYRSWSAQHNSAKWTPWLMSVNGDYNIIAPTNDLNEKTAILTNIISNEISRAKDAEEELQKLKTDAVFGRNLFNPQKATRGVGFWSYSDDTPFVSDAYCITDYIPVKDNLIMNTATPSGAGHRVYDKDRNIIRRFVTEQYTFKEGDAYVRFSVWTKNLNSTQIEAGETVTPFEAYTQHSDVDEQINKLHVVIGNIEALSVAGVAAQYTVAEYRFIAGHKYRVTNEGSKSVADLSTWHAGTKIDTMIELKAGETWEFTASADASEFRVYFADEQIVKICEIPIKGKSISEQFNDVRNEQKQIVESLGGNNPYILYKDDEILTAVHAIKNGCVMRKRGYDIPLGSSGNGSMLQFSVRKLDNDVVAEFLCNTNIPAARFSTTDGRGEVTQMGNGLIKVTITPTLNASRTNIDAFLIHYGNGTDKNWYLRLSCVKIYPQTAEAAAKYSAVYPKFVAPLLYDVFEAYDHTTDGFGVRRFKNIVDADAALTAQGYVEKFGAVVRMMPGEYNFAELFPIASGESGYVGILTKTGVIYESFDVDLPECTRIVWDGHHGVGNSTKLTAEQAMARSPFHIGTLFRSGGRKTIIRGFHFICSNIRYCIHPEAAGYGNKQSWVVSDCILEWNGSAMVDGFSGRNLGIGISCGENGLVERVKFCGSDNKGIGGHNNPFSTEQTLGASPSLAVGAKLTISRCEFGGGDIYMTTFAHDNMTPDSLIIESCSNIKRAYFGFENGVTGKQEWRGIVVNSEIETDEISDK